MDHLYSSVVKVEAETTVQVPGKVPRTTWQTVKGMEEVPCRLDLIFLRPGKDAPPVAEQGFAPDRVGVMFCDNYWPLEPGQRIVPIRGPVTGVFDIQVKPDVALDYSSGHHIEVQIVETVNRQAHNGLQK